MSKISSQEFELKVQAIFWLHLNLNTVPTHINNFKLMDIQWLFYDTGETINNTIPPIIHGSGGRVDGGPA